MLCHPHASARKQTSRYHCVASVSAAAHAIGSSPDDFPGIVDDFSLPSCSRNSRSFEIRPAVVDRPPRLGSKTYEPVQSPRTALGISGAKVIVFVLQQVFQDPLAGAIVLGEMARPRLSSMNPWCKSKRLSPPLRRCCCCCRGTGPSVQWAGAGASGGRVFWSGDLFAIHYYIWRRSFYPRSQSAHPVVVARMGAVAGCPSLATGVVKVSANPSDAPSFLLVRTRSMHRRSTRRSPHIDAL